MSRSECHIWLLIYFCCTDITHTQTATGRLIHTHTRHTHIYDTYNTIYVDITAIIFIYTDCRLIFLSLSQSNQKTEIRRRIGWHRTAKNFNESPNTVKCNRFHLVRGDNMLYTAERNGENINHNNDDIHENNKWLSNNGLLSLSHLCFKNFNSIHMFSVFSGFSQFDGIDVIDITDHSFSKNCRSLSFLISL